MDNLINLLRQDRITKGELKYGPVDLENDKRDFIKEALDEVLDGINYATWAFEKGQLDYASYSKIDKALCDIATMLLSGQA